MHPPRTTSPDTRAYQRAAARCDLLLAQIQELLGELDRAQLPTPAALNDASTALAQAASELHEPAGHATGYADALIQAIGEQDQRAGLRLAEQAEQAAQHLLALATSAQLQGRLLPWGVEPTARSLADWARRLRARP